MKLTVIGFYGAYPEADGATSGYLLEAEDTRILVDCGSGVLAKLQTILPLSLLDGVIISHYHPDHDADLGCLHHAVMIDMKLGIRKVPLAVWGPGEEHRLGYGSYCLGNSFLPALHFQLGAFAVKACANQHAIPSYAFKISAEENTSLVFSGDTGYYEELADFANDADCFLCEASFYAGQEDYAHEQHLTSTQAGEFAQKAGAKRLVLTHFPHYGQINQLRDEAGEKYTGELMLASRGMQMII